MLGREKGSSAALFQSSGGVNLFTMLTSTYSNTGSHNFWLKEAPCTAYPYPCNAWLTGSPRQPPRRLSSRLCAWQMWGSTHRASSAALPRAVGKSSLSRSCRSRRLWAA